ncbi:hypothetical protein [Pengzhenrongella frigida]|uniref:Uncharacterized protein n=1 Tax=Pengzhenrongella frigida TaxID=1259133 RepID=A0A4Q5N6T1_9MICO|nr:hypothetical protein [Cellulomonas sp. HLT2-17]RYV52717.1 hypothetical protein EUA98_01890 [Cellulomonas sp. HLT2-17]
MAMTTYEVWVSGVIPEQDLRDLGAVTLATERASTVLYGDIADQAALFGLLARLRALGLEVIEVRQVPAPEPPPGEPATSTGRHT